MVWFKQEKLITDFSISTRLASITCQQSNKTKAIYVTCWIC